MTLATLVTMALCIKAGLWQYNKAEARQALQTQLNASLNHPPVALTDKLIADKIADLENLRYRRVKFTGIYETRFQVLLDNQVENTTAGYHVFTPMQVEGSQVYVLVNRGWIKGGSAKRAFSCVCSDCFSSALLYCHSPALIHSAIVAKVASVIHILGRKV